MEWRRRGSLGSRAAALFLLALACCLPAAAMAQEVQRIAAIVNDEIVSGFDLDRRIDLMLLSTGQQNTTDNRRRVRREALRALVDEKLQTQEARRLSLKISEDELRQGLLVIERQNRLPEGQLGAFLRQSGIDIDALKQQITADLAWSKVVRRRLTPNVSISDEEVDEAFLRFKASIGEPEVRVSELFLPVDSAEQDDEIYRNAQRLVEDIRGGAPFAALARQFSRAPTAATGGDIGWMRPSQLAEELEPALQALQPGETSEPVRAGGGYYILQLRQRRNPGGIDPMDTRVWLLQATVPLGQEPAQSVAERSRRALEVGCEGFLAAAGNIRNASASDAGRLRVGDLPPRLREAATTLPIGRLGPPVDMPGALLLFMVCEREAQVATVPEREQVMDGLVRRRVAMLAQRYLRDLRRSAVVELR